MHIVTNEALSLSDRFARLNDVVIPAYEAERERWAELSEQRRAQINDWRVKIDTLEAILCHDLAAMHFRLGDGKEGDKFCAMAIAAKTRVRLHQRMASHCRVLGQALVPL